MSRVANGHLSESRGEGEHVEGPVDPPVGMQVPFCCPLCCSECLADEILLSEKPGACVLCFAHATHMLACNHSLCGHCWHAAESVIAAQELDAQGHEHNSIRVWGVSGKEISMVAGPDGVYVGAVRLAVAYAHQHCHPAEIKLIGEAGGLDWDFDLLPPNSRLSYVYVSLPWISHVADWAQMGEQALVEEIMQASRFVGADGPWALDPTFGMIVALTSHLLDGHTITMLMQCEGPKEEWGADFALFLASRLTPPNSLRSIYEDLCDMYDVHPGRFR